MLKIAAGVAAMAMLTATTDNAAGWRLESIPWQAKAPNGTRFALLEGRRNTPGEVFSYAFSIPASVWDSPHFHSATARVFVAKGTLRIGYGASPDKSRALSYPAGSYVLVPASAVHYDGADEDTIIIGTAIGPWKTTYLNGALPASAGTPINH